MPTVTSTPAWSSTDRYGTWANNGYDLSNDVWGSGIGPQTIYAYSFSNWGVLSNQPNTGGVKSYPHASKHIGVAINSLNSVTSSFAVAVPATGAYETAYDIWCDNNAYEIMLWFNQTGTVGPLGPQVTTAAVGGYSWNVHKGSNNTNPVFSFVSQTRVLSGTVDIKAVLDWVEKQGWFGNVTLGDVQFGFEITSTGSELNFVSQSFSVTSS